MSEIHELAASSSAIATAKVVIALAGAALALFEITLGRADRAGARAALRQRAWIGLAIASAVLWMRPGPLGGPKHPHVWELYHHVLGAKYFAELGYTRLYDCTLVADVAASFEIPPAERPIRRLETNRIERGDAVLAHAEAACAQRFSAARWTEFSHDVALFRGLLPPRRWATMLTDHGFNASPIWTVPAAALTHSLPLTKSVLRALTWIDRLLLAAMTGAILWGFGSRVTAIAWITLGTLYLSDYRWIGNAFLRFDWLALAGIGVALMRRGWFGTAGFALSWATGMRVFPGFLVAAVVLHAVIDLVRRRSLRLGPAHRRFALGCLVAVGTLAPLSVAVSGADAWPGFVANSRKHLSTPLLNFVGWKTVLGFDPATTAGTLLDVSESDSFAPWHAAVHRNFERRRPLFAVGVIGFLALLTAALRNTPLEWAPLLGIGLTIVAGEIGAYYYALLALYAGVADRIPVAGVLLLLFAAASHGVASAVTGSQDVVMAALSALALLLAVAVTMLAIRQPPTRA